MTIHLTWLEASTKLSPGDRVVFSESYDIFPDVLVKEGTTATVVANGLYELSGALILMPDDAELRNALMEWNGEICLSPPLDRATGNREPEWQDASPISLL